MKRIAARILLPLVLAGGFAGIAGGVADAATPDSGTAAAPPAIWVVPGLDAGSLLAPTVPAPTQLLAPVFGLITAIS
ncbi:hypothetical protein [Amycolatopsis jiangsuensis]|uniref:Secreted protein n=1 Tax=Amycolatopsis jiangsuensis TaxID=1181879 RepID=A0A840IX96_9PSEU|nr:hypothetical protein [Amycolatopsis jiangsuensis]MBB4686480.1 hypothetical protein [Amycolatopsis jiangsuensis]